MVEGLHTAHEQTVPCSLLLLHSSNSSDFSHQEIHILQTTNLFTDFALKSAFIVTHSSLIGGWHDLIDNFYIEPFLCIFIWLSWRSENQKIDHETCYRLCGFVVFRECLMIRSATWCGTINSPVTFHCFGLFFIALHRSQYLLLRDLFCSINVAVQSFLQSYRLFFFLFFFKNR